jgi:3-dehydroquinate synthase
LQLETLNFNREQVISRCIRLKRDIVSQDELDQGQRKLLNLGHTVGHALEVLTDYDMPHGYAVAAGCCIFARAFAEDWETIVSTFHSFGLPTESYFSPKLIAAASLQDKKRQGDTITLVIPKAIGDCQLQQFPISQLESIIKAGMEHE